MKHIEIGIYENVKFKSDVRYNFFNIFEICILYIEIVFKCKTRNSEKQDKKEYLARIPVLFCILSGELNFHNIYTQSRAELDLKSENFNGYF